MDINDAFAILKSNQFNDYKEVRKSYIDLVSVWHPDRFIHNEGLRNKAIEEMKQINIAWETIKEDFKVRNVRNISCKTQYATPVNKNTPYVLIRCMHCGTKNRILKDTSFVSSIKCGKCRKDLSPITAIIVDDIFEEIRFCAADTCSGRIKTDGHCNQCGKTREEILLILAADHRKKRIKIIIYFVAGVVVCLSSCYLWSENTTKSIRRSSQLPYEMKSSIITKKETKEFSHLNESGPELPLSVDGNTQNIIVKDIITPFEIIQK